MPLSRRDKRAHKNDFGHLLVVAGSPSMLGAACLVSLAGMRFGAGLVTAAVPRLLNLALQKKISHAVMTLPVPGAKGGVFGLADVKVLAARWDKFSTVALGPGLGLSSSTVAFVRKIVADCPLPVVVDADALNALAGSLKVLKKAKGVRVLTPHPGEFFRLSGRKPVTDRDRRAAAKAFAVEHNVVLVLKGHHTVVAAPGNYGDTHLIPARTAHELSVCHLNSTGNPGMAKAGMGDVLTGMIGALLAQGVGPFEAAKQAVRQHGRCGDILARQRRVFSLTAVDMLEVLSSK